MWTLPLHRDPVGNFRHPRDNGGDPTEEAGGGEGPGIH